MSAGRGLAELAREDGGIVVFVALLIPFVVLFLSLSVDIGNWWVHKRHLQTQVDAAALAGGAMLGQCFSDPAAANTAIQNEATRFGGGAGLDLQRAGRRRQPGRDHAALPEQDVRGRVRRRRTTPRPSRPARRRT